MMKSVWPVVALLTFQAVVWGTLGYLAGVARESTTTDQAIFALERCVHAATRADSVLRTIDTALTPPDPDIAEPYVGP